MLGHLSLDEAVILRHFIKEPFLKKEDARSLDLLINVRMVKNFSRKVLFRYRDFAVLTCLHARVFLKHLSNPLSQTHFGDAHKEALGEILSRVPGHVVRGAEDPSCPETSCRTAAGVYGGTQPNETGSGPPLTMGDFQQMLEILRFRDASMAEELAKLESSHKQVRQKTGANRIPCDLMMHSCLLRHTFLDAHTFFFTFSDSHGAWALFLQLILYGLS